METQEDLRCPNCKRISVKLIPLEAIGKEGQGQKVCRQCKHMYIKGKIVGLEKAKQIYDKVIKNAKKRD